MKITVSRTAAITIMLASLMVFVAGCIVPHRPYFYDRFSARDSYHHHQRDDRGYWHRHHRYWDRD